MILHLRFIACDIGQQYCQNSKRIILDKAPCFLLKILTIIWAEKRITKNLSKANSINKIQ